MKSALTLAALSCLFAASLDNDDAILAAGLISGFLLLLFRYADWFAEYWLGFGFMESFATDRSSAGQQGPVIKAAAWLLLLALALFMGYQALA